MTFSPVRDSYRHEHASFNANNVAFTDGGGSFGAAASAFTKPRELPRQRLPENFKGVSPLPASYSLKSDSSVSLYRARMENRNVVLCVLNGTRVIYDIVIKSDWDLEFQFHTPFLFSYSDSASNQESQSFLGFASFLSQLGPHPFLPELLGVISLRAPLITVIEEIENRDLLGFLWRCRQVRDLTEMFYSSGSQLVGKKTLHRP